MVVKNRQMIFLAAGLVAAVLLAMFLIQTEEDRIKKQYRRLSELIEKDEAEHLLVTAKKGNDIADLFADDCRLATPVYNLSGTYSGQEIGAYSAQIRPQFKNISLKFYDIEVDVISDTTAEVALTMTLKGTMKSGEILDETREMECRLSKIEDEWLFTEWVVVEVLRR